MPGSSFGAAIRLTTFGESHGPALGAVIDGMPAGLPVSLEALGHELDRRRPGRLRATTARNESDQPEVLSGVFEGLTLGTPICVLVRNQDARPQDYDALKTTYRPGHADRSTVLKHGYRDHRGGGRASGRETLARVIGGYFAGLVLPAATQVTSWIDRLGPFVSSTDQPIGAYGLRGVSDAEVEAYLGQLKEGGESIGARLMCRIDAPPAGLGEPVFDKLKSDLARAVMSIGAVTAFGYGLSTAFDSALGSEVTAQASHFGGIEGGISTGEPIEFECTVRPPSTVGEKAKAGRHDPCIAPRVVPVVEAMVNLVLADHLLRQTALDAFQPRPEGS
jgi:chorismate synthase